MSFFQTLTNAYVPYKEKLIERNIDASIINVAYNGCHRLVAHTMHKSTIFRQKTCLETMLFLIAVELRHIAEVKNVEVGSLKITVSMSLAKSIKDELRTEIVNIHYDAESFFIERIEAYTDMLSNLNSDVLVMIMILMLEKPLVPIERRLNDNDDFDYSIDSNNSQLIHRLDKLLQIQDLIALETTEARDSINRMYKINKT